MENIKKELKERVERIEERIKAKEERKTEVDKENIFLNEVITNYEETFKEEHPNNPAYKDRKEKAKKELLNAKEKNERNRKGVEFAEETIKKDFEKDKEILLSKIKEKREKLNKQYELSKQDLKNEKEQKIHEIQQLKSELLHKQVTIKTFNPENINAQIKKLEEEVKTIDETMSKQSGNIDFETEFSDLEKLENILIKPYTIETMLKELKEMYEENKQEENEQEENEQEENEQEETEQEENEQEENEQEENEQEENEQEENEQEENEQEENEQEETEQEENEQEENEQEENEQEETEQEENEQEENEQEENEQEENEQEENEQEKIIPYKSISEDEKDYLTKSITDLQISNKLPYNNVFLAMEKYTDNFFNKNKLYIKQECDNCKTQEELNEKIKEIVNEFRIDDKKLSFDAKALLNRRIMEESYKKFEDHLDENKKQSIFDKIKSMFSLRISRKEKDSKGLLKKFLNKIKEKIEDIRSLKNSDISYLDSAQTPIQGDTNGINYEDATIDDYTKGNKIFDNMDISFEEAPEGVTEKIKSIRDKKKDRLGNRIEKTEEEEMLDRNNLDETMKKEREDINIDIEI